MTSMHDKRQSRATTNATVAESVRLSHSSSDPYWDEALLPQHGEVVESCDQLLLTRQRVLGADGHRHDKLIQTNPTGEPLSTMDALSILGMAHEDICNEDPNGG